MHVYGKHPMCITAAAKSLQLCLTLCNPRDGSPAGSPVPGILQARTLEWVAILSVFFFFFLVLCLFIIYFWSALFVAACGLFLVAARGLLIAVATFVLELERGC